MIIRFSSDADAELAEARQWYAHQREDLDLEFMDSVDEALTLVLLSTWKRAKYGVRWQSGAATALWILAVLSLINPKRSRATLASALQMSFSATCQAAIPRFFVALPSLFYGWSICCIRNTFREFR